MPPLSEELRLLAESMDQAAEIARQNRHPHQFKLKPDGSIVTDADVAVESYFREQLARDWPGTTFWGEEFGRDPISGTGYWLIDPVDGTSNFAFGSPLWGISVALAVGTRIEFAAIWLPDLNEKYLGQVDNGAWLNSEPLPQIPHGTVQRHELVSQNERVGRHYGRQSIPGKVRCAGAFVVDGMFTATQRYRGLVGLDEYLYDAAASILINQELGAEVRWAAGEALEMNELIEGRRFDKPWVIFPKESGFTL
ncbi:MAG TPA: inositol monophosphatase family protein [Fimbriimonadaceae bacterium]|nr:inositol monophosphatase family protein [Fimbriimonadaceae bacterium]